MLLWLINSAVIPTGGYGTYTYRLLSEGGFVLELLVAIEAGVRHTIGYAATLDHLAELLAKHGCPDNGRPEDSTDLNRIGRWVAAFDVVRAWTPSRESYTLAPGEEALVVRLDHRVADPGRKHEQRAQSWDYGLLRRVE